MYITIIQDIYNIKIKTIKLLKSDYKKYKIIDFYNYYENKDNFKFDSNDFKNIIINIDKKYFNYFINIMYEQMKKEFIEIYTNYNNYRNIKLIENKTLNCFIKDKKLNNSSDFYKKQYIIHNNIKKGIQFNKIIDTFNLDYHNYDENVKKFYIININNTKFSFDIIENISVKNSIIPYSTINKHYLNKNIIINKLNSNNIILINNFDNFIDFIILKNFYDYYHITYFNKKILNYKKQFEKIIEENKNISIQK